MHLFCFTIRQQGGERMKKKKNMGIRILCALIFLGVCGSVMFAIYSLSAEDGQMSNARSEIVTEKIKEQVNTRLETTEEGIVLSERIKYFVILHSPYGSDWNANIRKLAHFSIYFTLAAGIYITLAILESINSGVFCLLSVSASALLSGMNIIRNLPAAHHR